MRKAVEDKPKNRTARFRLVRALMRSGKLEDALVAAKDWRSRDAYNLVAVRMLGDIYAELGRAREARRTYSAVVELLPKDASAQRALASVLKQSGDVESAYHRLRAAVALSPKDVRLKFELADAAHRAGHSTEARALFEEVAGSPDANGSIRYPAKQRLAQIYNDLRRAAKTGKDSATARKMTQLIDRLSIKGGTENDIKIYLTWDTDRSDVDLWIVNPAGEKVFYDNKTGKFGGALYDDVTTGYGPESFTAPRARKGTYKVQVNYFNAGRGNFNEARGEVVVILGEGTASESRHTLPYRLYAKGQTVTVAKIEVR